MSHKDPASKEGCEVCILVSPQFTVPLGKVEALFDSRKMRIAALKDSELADQFGSRRQTDISVAMRPLPCSLSLVYGFLRVAELQGELRPEHFHNCSCVVLLQSTHPRNSLIGAQVRLVNEASSPQRRTLAAEQSRTHVRSMALVKTSSAC